jgi:hypothetical protein
MAKKDDDFNELWREHSGWDVPEGANHEDYEYDDQNDRLYNIHNPDNVVYKKNIDEEDIE